MGFMIVGKDVYKRQLFIVNLSLVIPYARSFYPSLKLLLKQFLKIQKRKLLKNLHGVSCITLKS